MRPRDRDPTRRIFLWTFPFQESFRPISRFGFFLGFFPPFRSVPPANPRCNGGRQSRLEERGPVIRQAISCDICGRDKQQTNHWFVVYEHGAELRISGWSSHARNSAKSKHLCGQTCLHKLVDDFMARTLAAPANIASDASEIVAEKMLAPGVCTDTSLTSSTAHPLPARPTLPMPVSYNDSDDSSTRVQSTLCISSLAASASGHEIAETPSFNSRAWRAEAWKREQKREQRNPRNRRSIA